MAFSFRPVPAHLNGVGASPAGAARAAALVLGLMLWAQGPGAGPAAAQADARSCAELRQVEVESRQAIGAGMDYGAARERAIKQALMLAVGVVGAPGGVGTAGPALDYRTARARVLSQEVVAERVDRQGVTDFVVVTLRAGVCVPARAPVKEVIAFGDFLDHRGRPLPGARRQLRDFFASLGRSPRFRITEVHPAAGPSDIVIDARVLGGGVAGSGDRIVVRIVIEARFRRTGQVISSTADAQKRLKQGGSVLRYLPEAIERAIERAGPKIYVGIEQSPPPAPPPPLAAVAPPPMPPAPAPAPAPAGDLVTLYVPRCMESFRRGALAAAGAVDERLLDSVADSVTRCAHQAWLRGEPGRADWVVRDVRGDPRFAGLCDGLERELAQITAGAAAGSPEDRLRRRIARLCRDQLPPRLAVTAP